MEPSEDAKAANETGESNMNKKAMEEDTPDPDEGDLDDLDGMLTRPFLCLLLPKPAEA